MKLSQSLDTTAAGFAADGSPGLARELRRLAHNHRTAAAYQGRPELDPEQESGDTMTDSIVIKSGNLAANDPCALCGRRTDPRVGPELFLEGTWAPVCWDCGRERDPMLVACLETADWETVEQQGGLLGTDTATDTD